MRFSIAAFWRSRVSLQMVLRGSDLRIGLVVEAFHFRLDLGLSRLRLRLQRGDVCFDRRLVCLARQRPIVLQVLHFDVELCRVADQLLLDLLQLCSHLSPPRYVRFACSSFLSCWPSRSRCFQDTPKTCGDVRTKRRRFWDFSWLLADCGFWAGAMSRRAGAGSSCHVNVTTAPAFSVSEKNSPPALHG